MKKILVCWRNGNELEYYILTEVGPNYLKLLRALNGVYISSENKNATFIQDIIRLRDRLIGCHRIYSDTEVPDRVDISMCSELIVTGE